MPFLRPCDTVQEIASEGLLLHMISYQDMSKPANFDMSLCHFSSFLLVLWNEKNDKSVYKKAEVCKPPLFPLSWCRRHQPNRHKCYSIDRKKAPIRNFESCHQSSRVGICSLFFLVFQLSRCKLLSVPLFQALQRKMFLAKGTVLRRPVRKTGKRTP